MTSRRPEDIGPKQKLSPVLPPDGGLETFLASVKSIGLMLSYNTSDVHFLFKSKEYKQGPDGLFLESIIILKMTI